MPGSEMVVPGSAVWDGAGSDAREVLGFEADLGAPPASHFEEVLGPDPQYLSGSEILEASDVVAALGASLASHSEPVPALVPALETETDSAIPHVAAPRAHRWLPWRYPD